MAWTERYVRDDAAGGGDGTTNTNSGANGAWTLAEAITNYAAGQRLNVRAGTYANTTTTRTFGTAGTTTSPIWWRGFNTSPGDLETTPSLTHPSITFTTGRFSISAAFQMFSGLDISGAATAGSQLLSNVATTIWRCRMINTGANANSFAMSQTTTAGSRFTECYFSAGASATSVITTGVNTQIMGCVITGGGDGWNVQTAGHSAASIGNYFISNGGHGLHISVVSATPIIVGNTFYNPGTDGLRIDNAPTWMIIASNIFSNIPGTGINNNTGGNIATVALLKNAFYSNTTATMSGFGDWPDMATITEVASPFAAAGSSNFALASGALSRSAGLGAYLENLSGTTAYNSIGAWQPQAGGGFTPPNPILLTRASTY